MVSQEFCTYNSIVQEQKQEKKNDREPITAQLKPSSVLPFR